MTGPSIETINVSKRYGSFSALSNLNLKMEGEGAINTYYIRRARSEIVPELDLIRQWFAYNARARQGYLETFSKLSPGELARDRGASYPTLVNIFEHTLGAYYFWFSSISKGIEGLPRFGPIRDTPENPSVQELALETDDLQAQVDLFLSGLVEGDLQRRLAFPKRVASSHSEPTVSVRDVLWHLVEEELQHRGELNALLWQIDVDAPIFDWIEWVGLHKSQKA